MPSTVASLSIASLLAARAFADSSQTNYTVWGSVVLLRAGDHTPLALGSNETMLTSLGAQQLASVGDFFRSRYIDTVSTDTQNISAPLVGLNSDSQDDKQMYVLALDEQYISASALAFMQGFYPPSALNSTSANTLEPSSILGNGSYLDGPLGGYNFPHVRTADGNDVDYLWVGSDNSCPGIDAYIENGINVDEFVAQTASSQHIYNDLEPFLNPVIGKSGQGFANAWEIYDYMSYQYAHNSTVARQMQTAPFTDEGNNVSAMDALRFFSDQQQYSYLGNMTGVSPYGRKGQSSRSGSISTIAGATLAYKIIDQLATNIATGGNQYKLSILVGDYDPMLSFFALAGLPAINIDFTGLPTYGSALVFELFSYTSSDEYPSDTSSMNVRFSFRNGTGPATDYYPSNPSTFASGAPGGLQTFPLFGRGPSTEDMTWQEFIAAMSNVAVAGPADWCQQCGATNIFCAAWNASDADWSTDQYSSTLPTAQTRASAKQMSPAVAGVIGAIVTLAIAGLVALALFFVVGLGMRRTREPLWVSMRGKKSELGGFKGSRKLASDPDLVRSVAPVAGKDGTIVFGATVEKDGHDESSEQAGRERVGSWEMKGQDHGKKIFGDLSPKSGGEEFGEGRAASRRSGESARIDPFRDPVVHPTERV